MLALRLSSCTVPLAEKRSHYRTFHQSWCGYHRQDQRTGAPIRWVSSLFNEGSMSPCAQGTPPSIKTFSQKNTRNVMVGNLPALSCLKCNKRTILGTERGCQVLKTVTYPCKTHVVPVNLAESFSSLDEDDMEWTIWYSSTEQSAESALLMIFTVFKYVVIL